MTSDELKSTSKNLSSKLRTANSVAVVRQSKEFLRNFAGEKSEFYKAIEVGSWDETFNAKDIAASLDAFAEYIGSGLFEGISPERKAQIDVVSDLLQQAYDLLENSKVHTVAPTVIIGAALEEFLRNWIEAKSYSLGNRKPSISNYAEVLLQEESITKQDIKDIISWAGLRNHAAHGEFDEINDRSRIKNMLEGVNLFLRKYSS